MLNVSSPALYDDNTSNNVTMDNKRNTSMMGTVDPSARPTLYGDGQNLSSGNENISSEETINKTTYEFKIILLGSIAVGKTSILNRYITNSFSDKCGSTIKIDFKTKIMNINDNVRAKLHI
jgi:GTPase SAR1 family protein